jgi:hypothetical protein
MTVGKLNKPPEKLGIRTIKLVALLVAFVRHCRVYSVTVGSTKRAPESQGECGNFCDGG